MRGVWFKLAALLCAILSVILIEVISYPLPVVNYDTLGAYEDYMPGQDGMILLTRNCGAIDDYYEYIRSTNSIVCRWQSGPIYSASLTMDKHGVIQQAYFNVQKCGIKVGELILSTDAEIQLLRYSRVIMSTRRLVWRNGASYAWVRRGKVWTVYNTCIWGLYFTEE